MTEKLRTYFDDMVVYKDLRTSNFFSALSLPSFMRDWLLRRFEDEDGHSDTPSRWLRAKRNRPARARDGANSRNW